MKTKEHLVELGLSERQAEEIMLCESKMLENAVRFQYRKKDGSVRDAYGTLDLTKMALPNGELWKPKTEGKAEDPVYVRYFDLDKQDWRQFSVLAFVGMEG